jgi:hypothetical protein
MLLTFIQDMSSSNLIHNTKCTAKEGCVHGNSIFERAQYSDVYTCFLCAVLPVWQDTCSPTTGKIMWAVKPSVQVQCSSFTSDRKDDVTPIYLLIGFFPCTWICVMWWPGICLYTVWETPVCLYTCYKNIHIVMKNNHHLCGLLCMNFWDDDHSMSNIWPCLRSINLLSLTEFYVSLEIYVNI